MVAVIVRNQSISGENEAEVSLGAGPNESNPNNQLLELLTGIKSLAIISDYFQNSLLTQRITSG